MDNFKTEATWRYHNGTKHPNGPLMNRWHMFSPANRPMLFKIYSNLAPIELSPDKTPAGMPALEAIATTVQPGDQEKIADLDTLTKVLYFSAGITKKINYRWGQMAFRAAACTGALYHIELYLVCGDLPGLEAGVYHFEPDKPALTQLRQGDYRRYLAEASGNEPNVTRAPATIVYTDVFWRNACKYQAREYRHTYWDSGTILANSLAISAAHQMPAKVVAGFVDDGVNRLLDLNIQREVAVALLAVGHKPEASLPDYPPVERLGLKTTAISEYEEEFPPILEMHDASSLTDVQQVTAWRDKTLSLPLPEPTGQLFPLEPHPASNRSQDDVEPVIIRRGSTRQFERTPITFRDLSTILVQSTQGIPADFLGSTGLNLNHAYLIIQAVEGLPAGSYVFHPDKQALELIETGEFRKTAGYLGLNQALAADASVDIFFLSDLKPILERFGNRGYRAAQLEASITAGRIYLAAYAQQLGASGLTFYDDAVTDFFSPHAQGKSVMFMILLGKRLKRA